MVIPYALRTDGRYDPGEVDSPRPTFSWRLRSDDDAECVGFAVTVSLRDPDGGEGEIIWRSGTVASDAVSHRYGGPPLEPRSDYVWSVTTTSSRGATATRTARFETGLRGDRWAELGASWIARRRTPWFGEDGEPLDPRPGTRIPRSWQTMYAAAPLQLRRRFLLPSPPVRARLYISARGVYRAFVNGARVGDDELTPGWTRYQSAIEYQAYDVTDALTAGANALAVKVADGWWAGHVGYHTRSQAEQYGDRPELICLLEASHADGTVTRVVSDGGWRERAGETVMADLLMGEYEDRGRATPGWLAPDFADDGWRTVEVACDDTSMLRGQTAPPVRAIDEVPARSVTRDEGGRVVVDFGQNLVGRVRLHWHGQRPGSVVELRHGEMMDGDRVYTANLRSAEARDVVVPDEADGVFEPAFTCHGFRYAEITGLDHAPAPEDVTAVVLSSDLERTGFLETSSPFVDRLYANIRWGQLGNFVAVPTDCPQRDERLGWTADTQVFAPTAAFNSDVQAFLGRWLDDLRNSQDASGSVPDVVPLPPTSHNFRPAAPGWGDAVVIVPWHLYTAYGDRAILERQYPSMKAWVDRIAAENPDGLWTNAVGNNYGDWLAVDAQTPRPLVSAAYRIRSTDLIARAADALGLPGDAAFYRGEAARLRALFETEFLGTDGLLHGATQTGDLLALSWRLVGDAHRGALAAHLVDDIESRGDRLTTGFIGVSLLCPTLVEIGRPDLAYRLLFQEEFPSWGYSIAHGATTVWERWDGWTAHAGFQSVEMNSFNHYSLGSVGEWLYRHVAGIEQAAGSAGYRRVRIAPQLTDRIDAVSARYESVRGTIAVSWRREDGAVALQVELPPGTTADVHLPGVVHAGVRGRAEFIVADDGRG